MVAEGSGTVSLQWPLRGEGEYSNFVRLQIDLKGRSLPVEAWEQLGNVVHEIEGLVEVIDALEAELVDEEVVEAEIARLKADVVMAMSHGNHVVSEPGCPLCREPEESTDPPFEIGQMVRQRSNPERVARVVGLRFDNTEVGLDALEGEGGHTMSGWWPAKLLEPVPPKAPARRRRPLRIGDPVRHRDDGANTGVVRELGTGVREGYVRVHVDASEDEFWWPVSSTLPRHAGGS